ncbi:MAG: hypothetical protein HN341_16445 [Verrucomicrobia bacterium]|jgi:hypothetical protein|nr:hypothetical protein [Verrucomicrobiota bacterium]
MVKRRKRRNRKKRVDGFIFPGSFAGVLVFASVAALSYLWLCSRCEELGRGIKTLEKQKVELTKKFLNEEYKWMRLKSPKSIEDSLARCGISMTWPRRDQVMWLADASVHEDMNVQSPRENAPRFAGVRRMVRHE